MIEIRAHSPRELNPSGKFVAGVSIHFPKECFSRTFHMEGCRCQFIPGSIPTTWKIEPGKQSSKRQHRKVSLVQFYLNFSIVSARSILYVHSQTSLRFVNIFSSNLLSLLLFISPRCCILVFLSLLFILVMWRGRYWFTEPFNGFQSFQINRK